MLLSWQSKFLVFSVTENLEFKLGFHRHTQLATGCAPMGSWPAPAGTFSRHGGGGGEI